MKNINKILGVVLTIAMLAGLIVMAVPVSASDLGFTKIGAPDVTVSTNANVFTFAADGKTGYLYTPITTYLTSEGAENATSVSVNSTDGFPAAGFISISGDQYEYYAKSASSFSLGTDSENRIQLTDTYSKATVVEGYINSEDDTDESNTYAGLLYKTSDAGYNWTKIVLDSDDELLGKNITMIKVCKDDSSELIASDGNQLFKSTNSGTEWSKERIDGFTVGTDTIKSIDISVNDTGDVVYLIGVYVDSTDFTGGGVALYDGGWMITWAGTEYDTLGVEGSWGRSLDAFSTATEDKTGELTPYVLTAAFTPDYASDTAIVAVVASDEAVYLRTLVALEGYYWDDDLAPSKIVVPTFSEDSDDLAGAVADMKASVAFPSNYDYSSTSYAKVFVGIGYTGEGSLSSYGVWRTVPNANVVKDAYKSETGINVNSIAYKGTLSSGTLAVGLVDDTDIYTSTDAGTAGDGDANFNESADNDASPYKGVDMPKVRVAFNPTSSVLYAGTTGAYSALYVSNNDNYDSFSGISFIRVASLAGTSIAKDNGLNTGSWWCVLTDGTNYLIFRSTDTGKTWKMMRNNENVALDAIAPSPAFDTDQTVYFVQMEAGSYISKLLKTTDAGQSWDKVTTPGGVNITGIAVIDANTYWCGSTDGIRKSGTSTTASLDGQTPQVMIPIPGFFFVFCNEGSVWMSTDEGASFQMLGDDNTQFASAVHVMIGAGGPPGNFEIFPPTKTVWAQDINTGDILSYTVGVDDSWQSYIDIDDLPEEIVANANPGNNHGVDSFANKGGVWFIWSVGCPAGQLWKSTDIEDKDNKGFSPVYGTISTQSIGGTLGHGPVNIAPDANGNFVYTKDIFVTSAASDEIGDIYKTYTDTLTNAPGSIAPAANDAVDNKVDFSWKAISGSEIKYDLEVDYTADFNANVLDTVYNNTGSYTKTSSTQISSVNLLAGKTYYWRVRAAKAVGDLWMLSKWSEPIKFTTKMASSASSAIDVVGRISPSNGATDIATNATLGWGTVDAATGYNVVIATDSAFANVFDQANNLTVAVYKPGKAFEANTTYFWKVQALNGTNAGNWIASSFTTASAAAPTGTGATATQTAAPPQTVIVTAPPQPTPIVNVAAPTAGGTTTPAPTPAYVWVIIVIGAILVIAVIVLIVRTRRV